MDDIQLDIEDPRQTSAKKIKVSVQKKAKRRTFWQYLFDLIIKTVLCSVLIGLNFTLFANAGSYHLFSSAARLTPEAEWIYIGIAALSFVLVLAASFSRHLQDAFSSLIFALVIVALINQFAVFEKHSGLLILFNGLFSDAVNAVLYEYAFLIIGAAAFVFFFILLKLLKRQFILYMTLGFAAVLGWVLSEAYLNPSSQYFKTVAQSSAPQKQENGTNIIVLSFNDLSSPNILRNMAKENENTPVKESLNNALGFYLRNNFTLYPNAMAKSTDAFQNLISLYNPQSEADSADLTLSSTIKDSYFDFSTLQFEKSYLKENALYKLLKEQGYAINVYQTRNLDTCYINNQQETALCKEKVSTPLNLSGDTMSTIRKTVFLSAQWLESTGFVSSINPLLKGISYLYTNKDLAPLGVNSNRLYAVNAFKVFDQIADVIDTQTGNQAYFAVIDLPSDTYVYDAFCNLKPSSEWISETTTAPVHVTLDQRRAAYAEQVSCLYGALEKFMQQLKKSGSLEDTTIVINGLNVPQKLNRIEQDAYRQLQSKYQVAFAVRSPEEKGAKIDTAICSVTDIIASQFITHEPCREFSSLPEMEISEDRIKEGVAADGWSQGNLSQAQEAFGEWFNGWAAHNSFENTFKNENQPQTAEDGSQIIAEIKTPETIIEDEPEQKLESITVAAEKAEETKEAPEPEGQEAVENKPEIKEIPEEVIPETLFDVGEISPETTEPVNNDAAAPAEKPQEKAQPVPEINPDIKAAEEATTQAIQRAKQALAEKQAQKEAEKQAAEQKLNELSQSIETIAKNEKLRDVLEAPVATNKELSPEQLKEKLHQNLNETAKKADKSINIEIKVLDGKPNS